MLKQVIEMIDLLDNPQITGEKVIAVFQGVAGVTATSTTLQGNQGSTDFVKIIIEGTNGKTQGGTAPTLGIIGRLGGIAAHPSRKGLVSDADGAIGALASALKLTEMRKKEMPLEGDIIVTTHICPNAPTQPHEPVDFMGSPVEMSDMNEYEILPEMDAIISIDATKGNNIINHRGFAISPTVKEGYILRISDDLVRLMTMTTGQLAVTFPITMQDITPYGNDVYHINSILQPATATSAPVVGLALTAESAVPGCGTGANHEVDIASAVRFVLEVAKEFVQGKCKFYDSEEFSHLEKLYGKMTILQTMGKA
ncbi:DUF1177 domain-containing protein [Enterococcus saccharolyticus]|uniref:DUF1177 domain-containing protein n=1 Tax=Candidatus Enterococcus willemsii TaxID=1857215 RepID=A0ABQ6YZI3_9ENTE|nr:MULTISPECIES: DUF1177 domain-containing protein [Enterococcus]KAF1303617.1 hypothetical protein BAU17_06420 [Enterococcus sp. CU12B]MCD5001669.1 DUF1177 domain-containing protein [Enterococcus saccharolyticus]